jgi:hypothetical protein
MFSLDDDGDHSDGVARKARLVSKWAPPAFSCWIVTTVTIVTGNEGRRRAPGHLA